MHTHRHTCTHKRTHPQPDGCAVLRSSALSEYCSSSVLLGRRTDCIVSCCLNPHTRAGLLRRSPAKEKVRWRWRQQRESRWTTRNGTVPAWGRLTAGHSVMRLETSDQKRSWQNTFRNYQGVSACISIGIVALRSRVWCIFVSQGSFLKMILFACWWSLKNLPVAVSLWKLIAYFIPDNYFILYSNKNYWSVVLYNLFSIL